jgi:ubiquitin C-terminal hydrolase
MTKSHNKKYNIKKCNNTTNGHTSKILHSQKSNQQQPQPIRKDSHSIQPQKQQKSTSILKSTDEIFDPLIVSKYMQWKTNYSKPGPGLNNHGNTCFLNSTLQCLLHTPALSQVLLRESQVALQGLNENNSIQRSIHIYIYIHVCYTFIYQYSYMCTYMNM